MENKKCCCNCNHNKSNWCNKHTLQSVNSEIRYCDDFEEKKQPRKITLYRFIMQDCNDGNIYRTAWCNRHDPDFLLDKILKKETQEVLVDS